MVDAQEFRMCGETGSLETPIAGSSYEVWELQRRITAVRPHKWRAAARLGPLRSFP